MTALSGERGDDKGGGALLRVLIADDELILGYTMRGQLEQRGVDVVGIATNGVDAFARCRELRPDVVLMDVRMPETDGIEATRLIMQQCPTCVVIVTAFADQETRARADAVGAMGFLSKPVQATGVLEAVPRARARFAEFLAIRAASRDLEEALQTRAVVEEAERLLVGNGIAPELVFQVLRESAEGAGVPLRAMAESVIARGTCPG